MERREKRAMDSGYAVPLLVAAIVLASALGKARARRKSAVRRARQWGMDAPAHRLDADDLRDIASYCRAKEGESPCAVDAITWNDLNMDAVFARMDTACSNAGEEALYDMLHRTDAAEETLDRRIRIMEAVAGNEQARMQMRLVLGKLGCARFHGAHGYLFHPSASRVEHAGVYLAMGICPFAVLLLALFTTPACLLALIPVFAANLIVYYRSGRVFMSQIAAVRHIASVLETARRLCACLPPELEEIAQEMRVHIERLRPVRRWNALFAMQRVSEFDFLTDYLRIFFQLDMICLSRLSACFQRENAALRSLYAQVGELDACMAVAGFKKAAQTACVPSFFPDSSAMRVEARELVHPLIGHPVSNDLFLTGGALITGSNASGKSTFIKALAINAILAQTVAVCTARTFCLSRAQVMTSMALRDNVSGGESYFVVEVRSLQRVMEAVRRGRKVICMIDEILRGTNTVERIAASRALLEALDRENCLCMAATHDQELTRLLPGYRQMHFAETIERGEMRFSYRLLDGPSNTRNALLLMRQMGFPDELTGKAEACARIFDETGTWR